MLLVGDKRTLDAMPIPIIPINEAHAPIYNTPLNLHDTTAPISTLNYHEGLLAHLGRKAIQPRSQEILHHGPSPDQMVGPKGRNCKGTKKLIKEQRHRKWLQKQESEDPCPIRTSMEIESSEKKTNLPSCSKALGNSMSSPVSSAESDKKLMPVPLNSINHIEESSLGFRVPLCALVSLGHIAYLGWLWVSMRKSLQKLKLVLKLE